MSEALPDAWLARDPLPADPVPIVKRWLDEAFAAGSQPNPHAVALATIDPDGRPSARMVLCNAIDASRGAFVMYTNVESRKGRALAAHPRAAIVFYWPPTGRQARVEGAIERTPEAECDAYFATRPVEAQLSAWASAQSEAVVSRDALVAQLRQQERRFGVESGRPAPTPIPRPPHWGGFTLVADCIELWVSRLGRLHDRGVWTRAPGAGSASPARAPWSVQRLQP